MLTFAKVSFASFTYDVIDVFCFSDVGTQEIYSQNKIIKCLPYLIPTYTDSTSFFFVSVCQLDCEITKTRARELIFEIVMKINEIEINGLDESLKKKTSWILRN